MAALETAQGELVRQVAAYERTLDRVATAVAIFGPDQRLTFFNEAYRALWQLDADWLETRPTDGEMLDRLRELSRLPEVGQLSRLEGQDPRRLPDRHANEDWWHLPDGRTIHVVADERPDGGVTHLFDDVTERLALESRYNALINVQRETLDSLKEGVARVRHGRATEAVQRRVRRYLAADRAICWRTARISTRSSRGLRAADR